MNKVPPDRKPNLSAELIANISNITSQYKLKYGKKYEHMLEPRDQVMEH